MGEGAGARMIVRHCMRRTGVMPLDSDTVRELGACDPMTALLEAVGPGQRDAGGRYRLRRGRALARQMAAAGAVVTGVDPLGPAVPWTEAGTGRYRLLREGAERLPFDDGAVDLVLFIFSLHHLPPLVLPGVLREVARVLRPDGRLYVAEPVPAGPSQEVASLYHDETAVRTEAASILAGQAALFRDGRRLSYSQPPHVYRVRRIRGQDGGEHAVQRLHRGPGARRAGAAALRGGRGPHGGACSTSRSGSTC